MVWFGLVFYQNKSSEDLTPQRLLVYIYFRKMSLDTISNVIFRLQVSYGLQRFQDIWNKFELDWRIKLKFLTKCFCDRFVKHKGLTRETGCQMCNTSRIFPSGPWLWGLDFIQPNVTSTSRLVRETKYRAAAVDRL